ncbi:MAG: hypothetical protein COW79_16115 [Bdellovibrionales bacterium CG22_combo_CG10-13_8_21_14_all_38_13]|nr:MAG: hypothetical protein COW79_16115 [Bdellovibrionales bacterium CG22_combo_CG10-13_8_21_14_all_38_13]PIR33351.1 MAG: hypothetical protein COV36_02860 [Alphaproteobacteria bacterium CG11_big_fil_rev_8_21_14_0_20_44_7]
MIPIYKNFDGLEISFKGALPGYILTQLREAKYKAQEERHDIPIRIGRSNTVVLVGETGARGGYAFRLDTGFDKETWFIADSMKKDRWNIRVSIKSLNLALGGYYEVKESISNFLLNDLELGTIIGHLPEERISRFDFCIDFETESFEPNPKCIVAHTRSNRTFHAKNNNFEYSAKGKLIESIRIGTMPNRQMAIYNKRNEIIAKNKKYWWDIWGINKKEFKKEIWRFEARAGKKELNKWNLRKFEDFENKAGDVIIDIFNSIRYVEINENDSNQSRWRNTKFWDLIIKEIKKDLFDYISNAERKEILEGRKIEVLNIINKQISGSITSVTALMGMELDEIPQVLEMISDDVLHDLKENKEKKLKKFIHAKEKYSLLK